VARRNGREREQSVARWYESRMKKTVAYCRTALASQSDPLSEVTAQADALRAYARGCGMTVHETYMDAGVSGVTLMRPALQQLLADCRVGKIGVVLTRDADRLSRDTRQLIALLHRFRIYGVRVEFATGGQKFFDHVLSALAAFQKAKLADDARRARSQ
jgi:DNA invertase Pin-like site-specific DNA recombinase